MIVAALTVAEARCQLIAQVVKAAEALKPNEAIYLPRAVVARTGSGTLRFASGDFAPIWRRGDGLTRAREHAEMLLTGNPVHVGHDRRELVFALKDGPVPVANVARRGFHVIRQETSRV